MHCGNPTDNNFKIIISAFFMSVFFVICGILIYLKYPTGINKEEISIYVKKKIKQLMIPYFVFGFVLILFFQGLHVIAGESLDMMHMTFKLISLQGIESMWFLPCYMISEMLFVLLVCKLKDSFQLIFMSLLFIIVAVVDILGMPEIWIYRVLMKVIIGTIFIYAGYIIAKYKIITRLSIPSVCIMSIIFSISAVRNGFIGIGALNLSNVFLFFINGIAISIIVLFLGKKLSSFQLKYLTKFGKNTIVIVCTNNLFIEIIRLLDYKLTGNLLLRYGGIGDVVFTFLMIVLEYLVICISEKYLYILFGKVRVK